MLYNFYIVVRFENGSTVSYLGLCKSINSTIAKNMCVSAVRTDLFKHSSLKNGIIDFKLTPFGFWDMFTEKRVKNNSAKLFRRIVVKK